MQIFNKILIANRGEIAVRIIKAAKELDIKTVAVYSEADKDGLHVKIADEAYCIGERELSDTYLNIEKLVQLAVRTGAQAVHPGYGFLAENPDFVAACEREGLVFIGPSVKAISLMGNKIEARKLVSQLGIPMTQGATGSSDEIVAKAEKIPLPLLVKAAAGGGGKGMRIVRDRSKLKETIEATSREAKAYFGDGEVYVEQYIEEPRHIEIQVIGDKHGNVIHLYERECSIQRRYQKIIEESPSPTLSPQVREKMGKSAAEIAKGIAYDSAGTIEFLVDKNLNFYFLEMNTRIQVEHPVTEMVTGIDIVKEQILVAAGNKLTIAQDEVRQKGHAIEARIYAEDPAKDFMPSPGAMTLYAAPSGRNIRVDAGIDSAATVHSFYDPMISKLIVWGEDRERARLKLVEALENYIIHGIKTNIAYLRALLGHKAFIDNKISTKFCDENTGEILDEIERRESAANIEEMAAAFLIHDLNIRKDKTEVGNIWNTIGFWRFYPTVNLSVNGKDLNFEIRIKDKITYLFSVGNLLMECELKSISQESVRALINGVIGTYHISSDNTGRHFVSKAGLSVEIIRSDELVMSEVYVSPELESGGDAVLSPMPGKVIKVNAEAGQKVAKGEVLIVVEAMKMENSLEAPRDGVVEEILVSENDMVDNSQLLIKLEKED